LLRSRLPERLSDSVPPLLVELVVGLALGALAFGLRLALTPLIGQATPYAINFAAVAVAAVAAGWRSGLIAAVVSQLLVWLLLVSSGPDASIAAANDVGGLVAASVSILILLVTIALYQREVDKSSAQREQRLTLLDDALREIDHRTRNNYQTVLAMIRLQAKASESDEARTALNQVANRIEAIAEASQRLAVDSASLGAVRLDDHLCGLVAQIERGLSRDGIELECEVEEITASSEKATSISIIVNELVTNAIKHAFNGVRPGSVWVHGKSGRPFELIIGDNGDGIGAKSESNGGGLGSRLVESFARQLGAKHEVRSSGEGTTHRLLIPDLD
jgi:two-component system, sensor histidine kinase PdtaS